MSLRVAFQMDPIHSIDIAGDSSFALALEAQERGHKLFHYEPKNLSLSQLRPIAQLSPLVVRNITGDHFCLGEQIATDLKTDIDVIPVTFIWAKKRFLTFGLLTFCLFSEHFGLRFAP